MIGDLVKCLFVYVISAVIVSNITSCELDMATRTVFAIPAIAVILSWLLGI